MTEQPGRPNRRKASEHHLNVWCVRKNECSPFPLAEWIAFTSCKSDLLHVRDDRMIPTRSRWLRADNLRDLQLPFRIRRTDDGLEFSSLRRFPGIAPDHPGVGRHGWFDLAVVPGPAGIEAQFNFTDAVWPAEGNVTEQLFLPAERLIMTGAIDA